MVNLVSSWLKNIQEVNLETHWKNVSVGNTSFKRNGFKLIVLRDGFSVILKINEPYMYFRWLFCM